MRRVCAWCGESMDPPVPAGVSGQWITHGMCESCRDRMMEGLGDPLADFLDTLAVPVVVAGDDAVGEAANRAALRHLGKEPDQVAGRWTGDVFECAHAAFPEGCGRTIHCSGCAIRRTVEHTYRTGVGHHQVPATLKMARNGEEEVEALKITTERIGGRVLLKVESACATSAPSLRGTGRRSSFPILSSRRPPGGGAPCGWDWRRAPPCSTS